MASVIMRFNKTDLFYDGNVLKSHKILTKQGWQKSDKISGNNDIQMWANNTDSIQGDPMK